MNKKFKYVYDRCFSLARLGTKKNIKCKYLIIPDKPCNKYGNYDIRKCTCQQGFDLIARNIGYPKKSEPDYKNETYQVSVIHKNFACDYRGKEIKRKIKIYTGPTRGCAKGSRGWSRGNIPLYPKAGFDDSRE